MYREALYVGDVVTRTRRVLAIDVGPGIAIASAMIGDLCRGLQAVEARDCQRTHDQLPFEGVLMRIWCVKDWLCDGGAPIDIAPDDVRALLAEWNSDHLAEPATAVIDLPDLDDPSALQIELALYRGLASELCWQADLLDYSERELAEAFTMDLCQRLGGNGIEPVAKSSGGWWALVVSV